MGRNEKIGSEPTGGGGSFTCNPNCYRARSLLLAFMCFTVADSASVSNTRWVLNSTVSSSYISEFRIRDTSSLYIRVDVVSQYRKGGYRPSDRELILNGTKGQGILGDETNGFRKLKGRLLGDVLVNISSSSFTIWIKIIQTAWYDIWNYDRVTVTVPPGILEYYTAKKYPYGLLSKTIQILPASEATSPVPQLLSFGTSGFTFSEALIQKKRTGVGTPFYDTGYVIFFAFGTKKSSWSPRPNLTSTLYQQNGWSARGAYTLGSATGGVVSNYIDVFYFTVNSLFDLTADEHVQTFIYSSSLLAPLPPMSVIVPSSYQSNSANVFPGYFTIKATKITVHPWVVKEEALLKGGVVLNFTIENTYGCDQFVDMQVLTTAQLKSFHDNVVTSEPRASAFWASTSTHVISRPQSFVTTTGSVFSLTLCTPTAASDSYCGNKNSMGYPVLPHDEELSFTIPASFMEASQYAIAVSNKVKIRRDATLTRTITRTATSSDRETTSDSFSISQSDSESTTPSVTLPTLTSSDSSTISPTTSPSFSISHSRTVRTGSQSPSRTRSPVTPSKSQSNSPTHSSSSTAETPSYSSSPSATGSASLSISRSKTITNTLTASGTTMTVTSSFPSASSTLSPTYSASISSSLSPSSSLASHSLTGTERSSTITTSVSTATRTPTTTTTSSPTKTASIRPSMSLSTSFSNTLTESSLTQSMNSQSETLSTSETETDSQPSSSETISSSSSSTISLSASRSSSHTHTHSELTTETHSRSISTTHSGHSVTETGSTSSSYSPSSSQTSMSFTHSTSESRSVSRSKSQTQSETPHTSSNTPSTTTSASRSSSASSMSASPTASHSFTDTHSPSLSRSTSLSDSLSNSGETPSLSMSWSTTFSSSASVTSGSLTSSGSVSSSVTNTPTRFSTSNSKSVSSTASETESSTNSLTVSASSSLSSSSSVSSSGTGTGTMQSTSNSGSISETESYSESASPSPTISVSHSLSHSNSRTIATHSLSASKTESFTLSGDSFSLSLTPTLTLSTTPSATHSATRTASSATVSRSSTYSDSHSGSLESRTKSGSLSGSYSMSSTGTLSPTSATMTESFSAPTISRTFSKSSSNSEHSRSDSRSSSYSTSQSTSDSHRSHSESLSSSPTSSPTPDTGSATSSQSFSPSPSSTPTHSTGTISASVTDRSRSHSPSESPSHSEESFSGTPTATESISPTSTESRSVSQSLTGSSGSRTVSDSTTYTSSISESLDSETVTNSRSKSSSGSRLSESLSESLTDSEGSGTPSHSLSPSPSNSLSDSQGSYSVSPSLSRSVTGSKSLSDSSTVTYTSGTLSYTPTATSSASSSETSSVSHSHTIASASATATVSASPSFSRRSLSRSRSPQSMTLSVSPSVTVSVSLASRSHSSSPTVSLSATHSTMKTKSRSASGSPTNSITKTSTFSAPVTASFSQTFSVSPSLSRSYISPSQSLSISTSTTATLSVDMTHSRSLSDTLSSSQSPSLTLSTSGGTDTGSSSLTHTRSYEPTLTWSLSARSFTKTRSHSETPSPTATLSNPLTNSISNSGSGTQSDSTSLSIEPTETHTLSELDTVSHTGSGSQSISGTPLSATGSYTDTYSRTVTDSTGCYLDIRLPGTDGVWDTNVGKPAVISVAPIMIPDTPECGDMSTMEYRWKCTEHNEQTNLNASCPFPIVKDKVAFVIPAGAMRQFHHYLFRVVVTQKNLYPYAVSIANFRVNPIWLPITASISRGDTIWSLNNPLRVESVWDDPSFIPNFGTYIYTWTACQMQAQVEPVFNDRFSRFCVRGEATTPPWNLLKIANTSSVTLFIPNTLGGTSWKVSVTIRHDVTKRTASADAIYTFQLEDTYDVNVFVRKNRNLTQLEIKGSNSVGRYAHNTDLPLILVADIETKVYRTFNLISVANISYELQLDWLSSDIQLSLSNKRELYLSPEDLKTNKQATLTVFAVVRIRSTGKIVQTTTVVITMNAPPAARTSSALTVIASPVVAAAGSTIITLKGGYIFYDDSQPMYYRFSYTVSNQEIVIPFSDGSIWRLLGLPEPTVQLVAPLVPDLFQKGSLPLSFTLYIRDMDGAIATFPQSNGPIFLNTPKNVITLVQPINTFDFKFFQNLVLQYLKGNVSSGDCVRASAMLPIVYDLRKAAVEINESLSRAASREFYAQEDTLFSASTASVLARREVMFAQPRRGMFTQETVSLDPSFTTGKLADRVIEVVTGLASTAPSEEVHELARSLMYAVNSSFALSYNNDHILRLVDTLLSRGPSTGENERVVVNSLIGVVFETMLPRVNSSKPTSNYTMSGFERIHSLLQYHAGALSEGKYGLLNYSTVSGLVNTTYRLFSSIVKDVPNEIYLSSGSAANASMGGIYLPVPMSSAILASLSESGASRDIRYSGQVLLSSISISNFLPFTVNYTDGAKAGSQDPSALTGIFNYRVTAGNIETGSQLLGRVPLVGLSGEQRPIIRVPVTTSSTLDFFTCTSYRNTTNWGTGEITTLSEGAVSSEQSVSCISSSDVLASLIRQRLPIAGAAAQQKTFPGYGIALIVILIFCCCLLFILLFILLWRRKKEKERVMHIVVKDNINPLTNFMLPSDAVVVKQGNTNISVDTFDAVHPFAVPTKGNPLEYETDEYFAHEWLAMVQDEFKAQPTIASLFPPVEGVALKEPTRLFTPPMPRVTGGGSPLAVVGTIAVEPHSGASPVASPLSRSVLRNAEGGSLRSSVVLDEQVKPSPKAPIAQYLRSEEMIAIAQKKILQVRPRLGLKAAILEGCLKVIAARPQGPAASSGVQLFDHIIAVNGTLIHDNLDFFQSFVDHWHPGNCEELVVRRRRLASPIGRESPVVRPGEPDANLQSEIVEVTLRLVIGGNVDQDSYDRLCRIASGRLEEGDIEFVQNVTIRPEQTITWSDRGVRHDSSQPDPPPLWH